MDIRQTIADTTTSNYAKVVKIANCTVSVVFGVGSELDDIYK